MIIIISASRRNLDYLRKLHSIQATPATTTAQERTKKQHERMTTGNEASRASSSRPARRSGLEHAGPEQRPL